MPGRVWTKEKLIAQIRELHAQGADLSPSSVKHTHSTLFASARSLSHFGSWRAAIEAADLDYRDFKRIKQQWTREEIVERLRQLHAQGHDLLDPDFKKKHRPLHVAACAHRYFGSWKRAVEAAGLDHDRLRENHVWTPTRILRTIQELAAQDKPLGWAFIEKHEPGIYRAARRKENFGSWAGALRAAGVNVPSQAPQSDPLPVSGAQPIGDPAESGRVMLLSPEESFK